MNVNNITLTAAISNIFDAADNSSASFCAKLLQQGIGDRATAKPYAMLWAAQKYGAKIIKGQRGDKLPRNSDAERAFYRVLNVCFPERVATKAKRNKAHAVKYTRAQQSAAKLFLEEFEGKTKADKIRAARAMLQAMAE